MYSSSLNKMFLTCSESPCFAHFSLKVSDYYVVFLWWVCRIIFSHFFNLITVIPLM